MIFERGKICLSSKRFNLLLMKYFFALLLFIISSCSFAQKVFKENISGMNSNALYVSGSVENELWLFYERIFKKRNAVEIGFGKKWGTPRQNSLSLKTDQAQFYSGIIFIGSYKRYLGYRPGKHPYYLSALFFFKDYSFSPIDIIHIYKDQSSTLQTRSSHKQVYGLKFLLGRRINLRIMNQFAFILDIYTGIGVRARVFNDWIYKYCFDPGLYVCNCDCAPYSEPMKEKEFLLAPSFHLGLKVGFGFL